MKDNSKKAETHLNTCAVLSQLNRHDLAMQHAYQAVMIMQTKLLADYMPSLKDITEGVAKPIETGHAEVREFKDRMSVLSIAYHNLAVEQEFLKLYAEALQSYRMAYEFARDYLGEKDDIT